MEGSPNNIMIGISAVAPPAAFVGVRQREDLDRGTRPLSIVRGSRVSQRPSSISSQFLHAMLEVDLAFRHAVKAHILNIHDEIDSYFDKLHEEMRKEESKELPDGTSQPTNATSGGETNQNNHPDTVDHHPSDSTLGWEYLPTEKVSTPPLRIQKRGLRWA